MRSMIWFREDLRVFDNSALHHGCKAATDGTLGIIFITRKLWQEKNYGENKINFLLLHIEELQKKLAEKNINLFIEEASSHQDIENRLLHVANEYSIDALYVNERYHDFSDRQIVKKIDAAFLKNKKKVFTFHDENIISPELVLTKTKSFYTIFTPYKKRWLEVFSKDYNLHVLPVLKKQKPIAIKKLGFNLNYLTKDFNKKNLSLWPAGERVAKLRLKNFILNKIKDYKKNRDIPFLDATSGLSPYLAVGVISSRVCLAAALNANNNKINGGNTGILTWINELIWRDFYKQLIYFFPRLNYHEPFKQYTNKIKWKTDKELFIKWKEGKTGFLLVDAAMRQLNEIGWMHNRLRMLCASFLTKILFIDWHLGEKYFAQQLIDYDFAANNGGWQWSSSTGSDSVPYFRIFNPYLQQKKYDGKLEFIKKYLNADDLVRPPIIDYKKARKHVLHEFKKASGA